VAHAGERQDVHDDQGAELLFKAAGADKPTVLVLIDRNELEDQMLRNLAMLGLNNVQHAIASRR